MVYIPFPLIEKLLRPRLGHYLWASLEEALRSAEEIIKHKSGSLTAKIYVPLASGEKKQQRVVFFNSGFFYIPGVRHITNIRR